jgi:hypothetical protein
VSVKIVATNQKVKKEIKLQNLNQNLDQNQIQDLDLIQNQVKKVIINLVEAKVNKIEEF